MEAGGVFASIGECMMEVAPAGDGLHRLGFAGDAFNTAWAVRALLPGKVPVRFVSAVGRDWASDAMAAFMEEAGIDVSCLARDMTRSVGLYAIRLDASGERSFSYWRRDSAATRLADDPERLARALAGAATVFLSGITLAILPPAGRDNLFEALRGARESGAAVAFDPNFRPRLWNDAQAARESFGRAWDVSDVALPTFGDEAELWGDRSPDETAERLLRCGVAEVAIKNGGEPALVATAAGRHAVPARGGVAVVDATGAGDAFNGGYLAARMRGQALEAAARLGHEVAALAVATRGALVPVEAVERL